MDFIWDKNQIFDIKLPPSISIMPKENDKNNIMSVPVTVNLRKLGKFDQKYKFSVSNIYDINL